MNIIVQLSRILVGVLFIISGFIKANDTIGFSYKLEEYFELFHMPFFTHYAIPIAMFICIFEIIVGVVLLVGCYSRLNAWLLLLMIVFFTLLTGYSAITNKVTDCGCFGDAIKLKPFQSFIKDLVLLVFIAIIFWGHKNIKPLFNKTISNMGIFVALLVTTFFTFYTYMFLPKIDFLPYKVGNDIGKLMEIPEGAPRDEYEMIFIYEKGGQQFEFTAANLPADLDTYKFIDRKDKLIKEGYKPAIFDFKLYNDAGIDYTDSLLSDKENYKLILVQKSVFEGRSGMEPHIAALANSWQQGGYKFWALSATAPEQVEVYRHEHQLAFPYYLMDATPIKSMVRSNPGLILLKGNTVIKKWSAYNLPSFETVKKYMN